MRSLAERGALARSCCAPRRTGLGVRRRATLRMAVGLAMCCATAVPAAAQGLATRLRDAGSTIPTGMDYDGDGMENRLDVAFVVYAHLHSVRGGIEPAEIDVRNVELYEQIQEVISASVGDVNQDGVVDESDVNEAIAAQGADPFPLGADADLSGRVDNHDVMVCVDCLMHNAGPVGIDVPSAACLVLIEFEEAAAIFAQHGAGAGTPLPTDALGNLLPTVTDAGWPASVGFICGTPPDHARAVSDSWPPEEHTQTVSLAEWPDNHGFDISRFWSDDEPTETWPPNHVSSISTNWEFPPDHRSTTSSQWRPGHNVHASRSWDEFPSHPGHLPSTSAQIHREHVFASSQIWPAGHWFQQSTLPLWPHRDDHASAMSLQGWPDRNTHFQFTSSQWDHLQSVSSQHPPSHDRVMSAGWPPMHSLRWSIVYPANHNFSVSGSWPVGELPLAWPPNHNGHTSLQSSQPAPLPGGFFPPGHTHYTTMLDLAPIIFGGE